MIDSQKFIDSINKGCKNLFINHFNLKLFNNNYTTSIFRIEGTSKALNRFEIPYEYVNVLNWFDNFWLFIEIKLINHEVVSGRKTIVQTNVHISMSIFQGEVDKDSKFQLFRAEWDDYCNPDEIHSQPHWHLTSNQAIEKTMEEYSATFENPEFISILKEVNAKVFDVKKIHFAMNGNWQNDDFHIHKIDDVNKVVKWFQGVINHIRIELEK